MLSTIASDKKPSPLLERSVQTVSNKVGDQSVNTTGINHSMNRQQMSAHANERDTSCTSPRRPPLVSARIQFLRSRLNRCL